MDQNKENTDNIEHSDDELEEMGFSEFDDVENLDDFFEEEGQSGADAFSSEDDHSDDEMDIGTESSVLPSGSGKLNGILKSAVSVVVVLAVIGGAGYFISTNDGAKGFISDLTGVQFGSQGERFSDGLRPNNNSSDPFVDDIPMQDIAQNMDDNSNGSEDFPMPFPVANTSEVYMADDGGYNDLPQPNSMENLRSNAGNQAAPVSNNDDFAAMDMGNDFGLPSPEPVAKKATKPVMPSFEVAEVKATPPKTAAKVEPLPSPIADPAPKMAQNNAGATMSDSFVPMDNNMLPQLPVNQAAPEVDKPDVALLLGTKEPEKFDPAKEAEMASKDFYEASDNYLDIMPTRKPGYEIKVENSAAAGGRYIAENEPKIAGAPVVNNAPNSTNVVKISEDDPLLVAAERAMNLQRYDSALRLYETLEIMNPSYARALKGKADALRALGRLDEAELAYKKAQELAPHDTQVEGAILGVQSATNPNGALNSLLLKHKQDPINPNLCAQIAMSYAQLGDFERSLMFWDKANSLSPDNPIFLYNMAVAADKTGRTQDAIDLYERALYVDGTYHQGKNLKRASVYDRLTQLRTTTAR